MEIIPKIHSYWAYVVVLLAILFALNTLFYFFTKKEIDNSFRKLSLFTLISFHVQLLIGLATYFVSPMLKSFASLPMGELMKNDTARLLKVEHPMMMIAAILFVTLANAKIKKSVVVSPFILLLVILALFCVTSRIPYDLWLK
jgi:hypothetical protein